MNKKFIEGIKVIFAVIVIILSVITIILILIKIFGNSPDETTVIFSVLGILVASQVVIIGVLFQIKEDAGRLKEFKSQTVNKIKEIENKI